MSNKDRGGYNITDQYGMYFVTFTVVGWVDLFTRLECKRILVDALKYCEQNKGLKVHAYVIMSSHVHLILSSSSESKGLSSIIRDYKSHTSKELANQVDRRWSRRKQKRVVESCV